MARERRFDDDATSFCGSLSGESFSSTRKRNTCSLRFHAADNLRGQLEFDPIGLRERKQVRNGYFTSFHNFRFVIILLCGWTIGLMLFLRNNITVSILKMVNQTHLYMLEHPNRTMEDFIEEGYTPGGEFDWDNEIQQMIMSWYMLSYTIPQIATTKVATVIGSKWAMPASLLLCGLASFLTPMACYMGWEWVIALRMVNGIGASAIFPMMLMMIENWVPFEEISLGLTCAQVLQSLLSAILPLVTSILCHIHWSYSFYVPSLVTFATCILWILIVTDKPDENFLISQQELIHICGCAKSNQHEHSLSHTRGEQKATQVAAQGKDVDSIDYEPDDSYKPGITDILKVPSFYFFVLIWCFYCSSTASFIFILPTYMRQFLKIGITQNGLFCTVILSGAIISVVWPYPVLRLLQGKFKLSLTASRRITHFILSFSAGIAWIYVGFYHDCQLILFFINRCFLTSNDMIVTGTIMTNYGKVGLTGLAYSMINTCGNLSVVFTATFIGYILDYTAQSEFGWSCIYWALGCSSIVIFMLYMCTKSEPIEFKQTAKLPELSQVGGDSISVIESNLAKTLQTIESPVVMIGKPKKLNSGLQLELKSTC